MFRTARIKLTAWYLLIITAISLSFSVVIYTGVNREIERFARIQRFRIERHYTNINGQTFYGDVVVPTQPQIDPDLLNETHQRILVILAIINAGILVLAGYLGYILSGKTLAPIQRMLKEQQQFVSDASHELRTPIAALKSSLEVNLRDPHLKITEVKSEMVEQLEKVNQLQTLTDGLLKLLHHEQQLNTHHVTRVSINQIIDKSIQNVLPLANKKHIQFIRQEKPLNLIGDEEALQRLCVILLDNAIKYSPEKSSITITTSSAKNTATLTVSDQGIGIAKADIPHIFDRFYRADQARNHASSNGFGLGLAIAKEIVTIHHGSIQVTSKLNHGSNFTITLPLTQATADNNFS